MTPIKPTNNHKTIKSPISSNNTDPKNSGDLPEQNLTIIPQNKRNNKSANITSPGIKHNFVVFT